MQIIDAVMKRYYNLTYGIKPEEFNRLPRIMINIWEKISKLENEKRQVDGNK